MSDEVKQPEILTPTRGRDRRKIDSYIVRVSQSLVVRIRQMDMMTMVMNNLIPMHLLDSAQKFEEMERKMVQAAKDGQSAVNVAKELDPSAMNETLKFLKHYATIIVIEPKIVTVDDGNEDHIPVDNLTAEELMNIFYARAAQDKEGGPLVTKDEAHEFRGSEPVPTPEPRPTGKEVRKTAKLVDSGNREVIGA